MSYMTDHIAAVAEIARLHLAFKDANTGLKEMAEKLVALGNLLGFSADEDLRTIAEKVRVLNAERARLEKVGRDLVEDLNRTGVALATIERLHATAVSLNAHKEREVTELRATVADVTKAVIYIERQVREVWTPLPGDTYQGVHRSWSLEQADKAIARGIAIAGAPRTKGGA